MDSPKSHRPTPCPQDCQPLPRGILHTLINWATRERSVRMSAACNPVSHVKRYREPAPNIRFLTPEQIDEQLSKLNPHPQLQAMVAVYIYAGLRREEALWLTTSDIVMNSISDCFIRICPKTIQGKTWQPKTRKSRSIPLALPLRPHLQRQLDLRHGTCLLFPSPAGYLWNPDNFGHYLRDVNTRAGLPWTCLDFRHTFGSLLAQQGVSLYLISEMMGNSPTICQRHYASLDSKALNRAIRQFPSNNFSRNPG